MDMLNGGYLGTFESPFNNGMELDKTLFGVMLEILT